MVQLIVGRKGKGKTKHLLDQVNSDVKTANGNIVYLDKNAKHMYELSNRVRLVELSNDFLKNADQFIGFVAGILSSDHDIEKMFFDSFLKIAHLEGKDISPYVKSLETLSQLFDVNFVLSVSMDENELPEDMKQYVMISL